MVRKEVRRRTSLLMGVSLALLLGAAAAFFVFALPQYLLERLTVLSGLSKLMVQAEPPISANDRALLAALAGIGTMGLGWVLIDWLLLGRAGMSVLIRPREDDYEDDDAGYRPSDPLDLVTPAPRAVDLPMPVIHAADPRKPLSARTDIGDPPQPPVVVPSTFAAPPVPTVGRQDVPNGQILPPLDQLFADAARAPVPPPPIFPSRSEISPQPVAPTTAAASPRITPDLSGEELLNPTDIFKGLTIPAAPQMPQPSAAPPPPALPADFWMPVRDVARAEDRSAAPAPESPEPEPVAPPVMATPPAAAPVPSPQPLPARAEATPDMRMGSFPPDLPDLADSPFFTSPPPAFAAPPPIFVPPAEPQPTMTAFVPPAEPEPLAWKPDPEPVAEAEAISEPVTHWTPPPAPAPSIAPPPAETKPFEPPAEDMPLEDMLARLELGMQKRRVAALAPPVPAEPQRRPPPAYAAAPPVREVPPPVMAVVPPAAPATEPLWTPPVSSAPVPPAPVPTPPPSPEGDGLLDQPLHVALGVLRNLVRG